MIMRQKDIVYVVASQLGSVGMGITSMEALKGVEKAKLNYKAFSRGYLKEIPLNKKNLTNYKYLEYLTYPFRFLEKFFGLKINSFKLANNIFGYLVCKNLPKTKIYHTWVDISPKAIMKAKKQGATLILEGANSHPLNISRIMNNEYKKNNMKQYISNIDEIKKKTNIYNKFDYIMCPSDFVYDSFRNEGFDVKKLIKMPYGVDTKRFVHREKNNKKIKFVFVGSVQLRKGVQYLLEAWKELNFNDAELTIVGRVWPDANEIPKKYSDLKGVKFVGFGKPEEILKESDVFVSPSLEEGSALTCYEAMACGLPLIATYNTGSIARDKKDGFIIMSGDTKSLKDKMKYFYNHRDEIKKMGKSARKYVENFTWDNYGKRLADFYKEVLK